MKIIGIILFTISTLLALPVNAQNLKIKYGESTALKNEYEEAVQLDNGNIIVLKMNRKTGLTKYNYKPELLLVNKNMNTEIEKKLNIVEEDAQPGFLKKIADRVYYFFHTYSKSNKETTLNAVLINQQTLEPEKTFSLGTYFSEFKTGTGKPPLVFSEDGSKVFVLAEGKANFKNPQIFFAAVYDNKLNSIWKKTVTLSYSDVNIGFLDFVVNNDGVAFVAVRNYDEGTKNAYKKVNGVVVPAYKVKIITLNENENIPGEQEIDIQDHFVKECKLQCDANKNLAIAGLVQKKYEGNITGFFYSTITHQNIAATKTLFKDYPGQLVTSSADQKMASDDEKDPGLHKEFYIRNISTRANGSVDLLIEYFWASSMISGAHTDLFYTSGDLVNANINASQKINFTRIPKKQAMKNAWLFLGVSVFSYKDKLILLYNDNKGNDGDDGDTKSITNFNKSVLVMATIDVNGKLTKKNMIDQKEEDYIFIPSDFSKITENRYIISSALIKSVSRSVRFGILEITD